MSEERPFAEALHRLRLAGLRPTRQRLALGKMLFDGGDQHVTAESLHADALRIGVKVSLATVYNTLHQFTEVGLLRQVAVDGARTYFDTNVQDHHHFYLEDDGSLVDIVGGQITVGGIPTPPDGMAPTRIDVVVRVASKKSNL
jgi:Fur family iron response transcriptional regulator